MLSQIDREHGMQSCQAKVVLAVSDQPSAAESRPSKPSQAPRHASHTNAAL